MTRLLDALDRVIERLFFADVANYRATSPFGPVAAGVVRRPDRQRFPRSSKP